MFSDLSGEDGARDAVENLGYRCRLTSASSIRLGSLYTASAFPQFGRLPVESGEHRRLSHLPSCRSPCSGIGPDATPEFVAATSGEEHISRLRKTTDWGPAQARTLGTTYEGTIQTSGLHVETEKQLS
jgi:hypothetical protein